MGKWFDPQDADEWWTQQSNWAIGAFIVAILIVVAYMAFR